MFSQDAIYTDNRRGRFQLEALPVRRGFEVEAAKDKDIVPIIDLMNRHFSDLHIHESSVWEIHRKAQSIIIVRRSNKMVGATAFLPLNEAGFVALLHDQFCINRPDISFLATSTQRPAAIYSWAVCMPGSAVGAMGPVMAWMRQPTYKGIDIYARPGTVAGERFMKKVGFDKLETRLGNKPLWIYRRSRQASQRES